MKTRLNIIIAVGKTGGHLFPGMAIAQAFSDANPENRLLFIGTGTPFETRVLSMAGYAGERISVQGLKGRGLKERLGALSMIPGAVKTSMRIMNRFKPDLVVAMGSYAAGPVAIAAKMKGVKLVIHEQNAIPGITNRILAHLADRVFVSFGNTAFGRAARHMIVSGNPIRKEIIQAAQRYYRSGIISQSDRPLTVLIIGGSQGAHQINLAMADAVSAPELAGHFFFMHQTGEKDFNMVKDAYQTSSIPAQVSQFFDDMESRYQQADLVICRAGAGTLAEISVWGKAAILIPFPYAADNHQQYNAENLVAAGAAEIVLDKDLNGARIIERLNYYRAHRKQLFDMAEKARTMGRPGAARCIVQHCYQLLGCEGVFGFSKSSSLGEIKP